MNTIPAVADEKGTAANGRVTVSFDGVNLDNCIKQGMQITGLTRCPYCKQKFVFELHLHLDDDGAYNFSVAFSTPREGVAALGKTPEETLEEVDAPCVPCKGCVSNCPKLQRK